MSVPPAFWIEGTRKEKINEVGDQEDREQDVVAEIVNGGRVVCVGTNCLFESCTRLLTLTAAAFPLDFVPSQR